jgi:putative selenium metabolism protein SsnA
MSYLLKNTLAVTLQPPQIEEADLRIVDGKIAERAKRSNPLPGQHVIDLSGKIVIPGLVNAHTHLYSTLARGMPGPDSPPKNFYEILQKIWWRLDRALDEESIYYSALIGAIEAVRCGTTTLIDHHASPSYIRGSLKLIQQALAEVGVRGVLCYETTDRGGMRERDWGLEENDDFLRSNTNPLFRGLVGAHAAFTLSDDSLQACAQLAQQHRCGVHIHLAEDGCDAQISREQYHRADIIQHFAKIGLLNEKTILAHGIYLSHSDLSTIQQHRCWLIHNVRSNMNNSVGYAPIQHFGKRMSLGTDGFPADMFEETRLAFFKGRDAKNGLGVDDYVGFLQAGHQLCSELFDERFGTLEPGTVADLVILDYPAPTPLCAENLAGHLLFGMKAGHVTDVMVNGKFVLREGRLPNLEVNRIYEKARLAAEKLWRK